MYQFDFLVIGSGIAGLSFALKAAQHGSVAVVTKGAPEESNTAWAQGGLACVISAEDSFDLHIKDTITAGAGLCNEAVVRTVVTEGPDRVRDLTQWGVHFDEKEDTAQSLGVLPFDLGMEGGHSKRRILHSRDTTGREIEQRLLEALSQKKNVTLMPRHMAIDLITSAKLGFATENRVLGVYVLDESTGEVHTIQSPCVVLATGGCGRVYRYTTNPTVATGDGVAMAWRAGATIANMEFIQFHPTCLFHPQARTFLISEAVRGEGGVLVNSKNESFMEKYHPLASLAPRDIVARAIDSEIKRTGEPCVYLDLTHRPKDFITSRFPHIYNTCLALGIDLTQDPIPVVPAAHYQCGGVQTDKDGATNIRGLYAIGEVGCTGLHGANRLASNSLLEAVVMAHRAYQQCLLREPRTMKSAEALQLPEWEASTTSDVDEMVVIYHNWDEIRQLMWDYVGIVRTNKRLKRAAARLRNLQTEIQEFYWGFKITPEIIELRNLATVASLIVDSARTRHESRGLHFTLDYPQPDNQASKQDTLLRRYEL